eukprot:148777_1
MWLFGGSNQSIQTDIDKSKRKASLQWNITKDQRSELLKGKPIACSINALAIPLILALSPLEYNDLSVVRINLMLPKDSIKLKSLTIRCSLKCKWLHYLSKSYLCYDELELALNNQMLCVGVMSTQDIKIQMIGLKSEDMPFGIELEILGMNSNTIAFHKEETLSESVAYEVIIDSLKYKDPFSGLCDRDKDARNSISYSLDTPGNEWTIDYKPFPKCSFILQNLSFPERVRMIRVKYSLTLKMNNRFKKITKESSFTKHGHTAFEDENEIVFKDFVGDTFTSADWLRLHYQIQIMAVAIADNEMIPRSKWGEYGIILNNEIIRDPHSNEEKYEATSNTESYQNQIDNLNATVTDISNQFNAFKIDVTKKMNAMQTKIDAYEMELSGMKHNGRYRGGKGSGYSERHSGHRGGRKNKRNKRQRGYG